MFRRWTFILSLLLVLSTGLNCARIITTEDLIKYSPRGVPVIREKVKFIKTNTNIRLKWDHKCNSVMLYESRVVWTDNSPFLSSKGNLYVPVENKIYSFNLTTGIINWQSNFETYPYIEKAYENEGLVIIKLPHKFMIIKDGEFNWWETEATSLFYDKKKFIGTDKNSIWVKNQTLDKVIWERKLIYPLVSPEILSITNGYVLCQCFDSVTETTIIFSFEIETGNKMWDKEIKLPPHLLVFFSVCKEIILFNAYYEKPKEKNIYALELNTGKIKWEKEGNIKLVNGNNAYIWEEESPDTIYIVDINTGNTQKMLTLEELNGWYDIFLEENLIIYCSGGYNGFPKKDIESSKLTEPWYEYICVFDEEIGKQKWKIDVGKTYTNPRLNGRLVYSGDKSYTSLPHFIDNTFVVDIKNGMMLWKLQLEGDGESLITRLIIRENMGVIKSYNGWLYVLEWGE